jgi:ABC-type transport system substrate-binding protein
MIRVDNIRANQPQLLKTKAMSDIKILWFVAIAGLSGLLQSCMPQKDANEQLAIFRYNESAGIATLDPAFAKDLPHIWACNQLYNGLVALDENLHLIPAIAKSWHIDSSGLIYTFNLRQDVYFHRSKAFPHETRKVNAHDFVYSFNRLLNPHLSSPGTWIFNQVHRQDGSHAFNALNDSTLQIKLSSPFPAFLGVLAMTYAAVVPFEAVQYFGTEFRNNPVGTGPFQFQYWKEGVKLVFRKNPDYFEFDEGIRLPHIDAVAISFLIDRQTAFMEFVKENLDFMSGIDSRYKDELLTRDGRLRQKYTDKMYLIRQPYLNTEYIGIFINNMEAASFGKPLNYKAVRKAINYAIDRERMLRFLRNGIGKPGTGGMIPYGMPGHNSRAGYRYDPEKARQLLEQSSVVRPQLTITTTADYVDIIKFVQSQLNDNIHISCPFVLAKGRKPSAQAIAHALLKNTANPGKVVPRRASSANIRPPSSGGCLCRICRHFSIHSPAAPVPARASAPAERRFCFRNHFLFEMFKNKQENDSKHRLA